MTNSEAAKQKVELARKHIADQQQRIARHKELVERLKRDNRQNLLRLAHQMLDDLERVLAGMIAEQKAAEHALIKTRSDRETSTEAVLPDRPSPPIVPMMVA
jgi:hypothetical protein